MITEHCLPAKIETDTVINILENSARIFVLHNMSVLLNFGNGDIQEVQNHLYGC